MIDECLVPKLTLWYEEAGGDPNTRVREAERRNRGAPHLSGGTGAGGERWGGAAAAAGKKSGRGGGGAKRRLQEKLKQRDRGLKDLMAR